MTSVRKSCQWRLWREYAGRQNSLSTLIEENYRSRHRGPPYKDGTNLFISGFTAGYPKLIPKELARRAKEGENFKINLFAGASTGDAVDRVLAEADVVNWRRPYMSDPVMRSMINEGEIAFKDDHLSSLASRVRSGDWGEAHVAVVEAVAITEKGALVPTMSVGKHAHLCQDGGENNYRVEQQRTSGTGGHSRYFHS